MTQIIDTERQCLIDDGEGNLFLCPAYKRSEAVSYFEQVYERMVGDDYLPPPLPGYLIAISEVERLTFKDAKIE
jgi:hypothetical protein